MRRRAQTLREPLYVGPVPLRELLVIVLIGALLLLLFFGITHLVVGRDTARTRDQAGASFLEGSAVITGLGFAAGSGSGSALRAVFLELDGRPVTLELWDSGSVLRLQSGQKVTFTYTVGRSGAWYIKRIARASEAKSHY